MGEGGGSEKWLQLQNVSPCSGRASRCLLLVKNRACPVFVRSFRVAIAIALRPQRPYGVLGTETSTPSFTQLLSSVRWYTMLLYVHRDRTESSDSSWFVQCCFTSTETVRTIRNKESRTSTSSLTQLLSSEFEFNVALRPQRPQGLLGTGSPGRPPRLSHNS